MGVHIDLELLELTILLGVVVSTSVIVAYPFLARLCRAYFARHLTTADSIPLLGLKRDRKIDGTAVVCGGSISGLLTARVCADHFTDVFLIDPELTEIERTKPSARIPQYDSLHGYLTIVYDGMRRLFPNFDSDVIKAGGIIAPADVKPYFSGVLLPAPYAEYAADSRPLPSTMYIRRPQLENLLRRLVLGSPSINNVRTLSGTVRSIEVPSLEQATKERPPRVRSVTVRTAAGQDMKVYKPALVVDCTGDSQAGFKWLKKAGYADVFPADIRLEYDQRLYYVTVTFSAPPELQRALPIPEESDEHGRAGWLYTFVPHPDKTNVGFVLGRMDNDTMQLCCGAWGDAQLPLEAADIVPFIESLNTPEHSRAPIPAWLIETLSVLAEEGAPRFKPLKIRPCSNIQYDKLSKSVGLPSNFVAVGDSMLQLNPIYAQGCSKAMMGAATLNAHLFACRPSSDVPSSQAEGPSRMEGDDVSQTHLLPKDFARKYFNAVGTHGRALWDSTKTFDYGFSSTRPVAGETLEQGRLARLWLDWFVDAAVEESTEDTESVDADFVKSSQWASNVAIAASAHANGLASILWHVRMLLAPPTDMFALSAVWCVVRWRLQRAISGWRSTWL